MTVPYPYAGTRCVKCGLTYPEHIDSGPKHLYYGVKEQAKAEAPKPAKARAVAPTPPHEG